LEEIRHGLPNKRLSGTSFNFLIWKNESNQTHVSGQTLSGREGGASYQQFEVLLGELHKLGFFPTSSLVSDVAREIQ
jgi:hypothetical protein